MSSRLLSFLLLTACLGGAPRVAAGDVRSTLVHMDVALDRALDAHAKRETEVAQEAWREAHKDWDTVLAPGLEPQVGPLEIVELELHLARIRAELDKPEGKPAERVEQFRKALESPLRSLPPAPGG